MRERTYLLVKPDGLGLLDEIRQQLYYNDDVIVGLGVRVSLTSDCVRRLYPERMGTDFENEIIDYMTSGECVIFDVEGDNAIQEVKEIKGKTYKSGLRLKYADNFIHNTVHCPDDEPSCRKELDIIMSETKRRLISFMASSTLSTRRQ